MSRHLHLYCTEESARARRGRARGQVKLTQGIHMVYNARTAQRIPPIRYNIYSGAQCLLW